MGYVVGVVAIGAIVVFILGKVSELAARLPEGAGMVPLILVGLLVLAAINR